MKKSNTWAYIGLINIVLGAAFIIWGAAAPGFEHKTFDYRIVIPLALGMAMQVVLLFSGWKIAPLLASVFYAAAFGLTVYHAAPIVMDMINRINFLDGNWTTVQIQLTLLVLILLISVIIAFAYPGKKEAEVYE